MLKIAILCFSAAFLIYLYLVSQQSPLLKVTYSQYKKLYNLHFQSKFEDAYRQKIYYENLAKISQHNHQTSSYKMGINQFTYLTQQEFVDTYLGLKIKSPTLQFDSIFVDVGEVNWNELGAVTPVKTQGTCAGCWAFSTTGAIEGLSKIGYNNLQSFSQQQLIDCSTSYGTMGCSGGSMQPAYKYVKANGITIQSIYPYLGLKGTCLYSQGSFKISSFTQIRGCAALTNALIHSPISVSVDATNWSNYKQGIFNNCGSTILNHAVLLTGISNDYWKIKNSWGTTWGEKGYIRLSRGNTCGVCSEAYYPVK